MTLEIYMLCDKSDDPEIMEVEDDLSSKEINLRISSVYEDWCLYYEL